ncbi:hypothetical protein S40285_00536 [Stachybotrys chlorohalonatus IBT 40285]|uniref:Membrane zinc transporter n=1 Tax=Stachybotrys chlorohalonatus (strain IBT 40285) TaxID=1283841 RepID=A0A084QN89_STAC4|nr:hypothetical protein S40285_00536 [Stachybotrys chlorohalonata IBT 40285]
MADAADQDCSGDPVDYGNRGLRIAAIFIILVASLFGALAPVYLARQERMHVPKLTFFVCKYVGSGVIIATAFMHLLEPAVDNLGDPCLEPTLGDYPWAFAIALMTVMAMFYVELLASRAGVPAALQDHDDSMDPKMDSIMKSAARQRYGLDGQACPHEDVEMNGAVGANTSTSIPGPPDDVSYPPGGQDHLGHQREHQDGDSHATLAGRLTSIFILEFGVIFHSVFIGLTLGTTDNLEVLLIVLVFHQMFEGLGLGSRLADAPWPRSKRWLPYLLALGFAVSTPIGVAAGIAAHPSNANTQKLINGIFDAISAGILLYTGLVELLAHEFMFNEHMRRASLKTQHMAFGCVAFGVAVMALLAKWA